MVVKKHGSSYMFPGMEYRDSYIDVKSPNAFRIFTNKLYMYLKTAIEQGFKCIVFICIGTDRSTGDSLGPLVGYKLTGMNYSNVYVYGNLDEPVHAKNLNETVKKIYAEHVKPFIVAIDACLGKIENVGCLCIGKGSIKPGSGVKKELLPIGDMYITGIVNFAGIMEILVLQNTRLNIVMKMADIISSGIRHVLLRIENEKEYKAE